jgi:hypothetical protein
MKRRDIEMKQSDNLFIRKNIMPGYVLVALQTFFFIIGVGIVFFGIQPLIVEGNTHSVIPAQAGIQTFY